MIESSGSEGAESSGKRETIFPNQYESLSQSELVSLIRERDRVIGHLKALTRENWEGRLTAYINLAVGADFFLAPALLVAPTVDLTETGVPVDQIVYSGPNAVSRLGGRKELIGLDYLDAIGVPADEREKWRKKFNNRRMQVDRVPVLYPGGKKEDVNVVKVPLFYKRNHDITFVYIPADRQLRTVMEVVGKQEHALFTDPSQLGNYLMDRLAQANGYHELMQRTRAALRIAERSLEHRMGNRKE